MGADIIIRKLNESRIYCECDHDIALTMYEYFSFEVPGAKFQPLVRSGQWDGRIRLFQSHDYSTYMGLLPRVLEFAKLNEWTVEYDKSQFSHPLKLSHNDVNDFISALQIHSDGQSIDAREHQLNAIFNCLIDDHRSTILSPTASGKSYIIYVLARFFEKVLHKKVLIVVPTVNLVTQMFSDFADYSSEIEWSPNKKVHRIMGGKSKDTNKQIVVSTWQSIYKQPAEYHKQWDVVIVDEVHLAQANSIKSIMENSSNAQFRYGLTGTLSDSKCHSLVIEGLFGKVRRVSRTKDLIEKGLISPVEIKVVFLEYNKRSRALVKPMKYIQEVEYTALSPAKLEFTSKLATRLAGNTLVLVNWVEKHGKPLYKKLLTIQDNPGTLLGRGIKKKKIFFISGGTEADQREEIRQLLEIETNCILVATYGTLSTGVNIKNLDNIIFAATSKSKIRVLQSIGRGLRMKAGKLKMILYDLVDNLTYIGPRGGKKPNYLMKHYFQRHKFYKEEGFPIAVHHKKIEED